MAKLKVHLLNFHSIFSHAEIVLEDKTTEPHCYYGINRWQLPQYTWGQEAKLKIGRASSKYSFDIEANPNDIVVEWNLYWHETRKDASIVGKNCAVAAQWFLTKFANIPKPSVSNVSLNLVIFPIFWPSIIPCSVTTAGRVMSNAKFYIEARNHPEVANKYSRLFLHTSMAVAALVFGASIFALAIAATVLTGGIAGIVIAAGITGAVASSYGFFKAANTLSAKNMIEQAKTWDEPETMDILLLPGIAS